jgi:hypothetical protein
MGFRYGTGRYGMGLYSYKADWWQERVCGNDLWVKQECLPRDWGAPDVPPAPPWAPSPQQAVVKPPKVPLWRATR